MAPRHWCFTWNSHTADDISIEELKKHCSYFVYQTEIGTSGREHVQGFLTLNNRDGWALRTIRERLFDVLGGAHFEPANSIEAAIAYCKKDGQGGRVPGTNFVEWGTVPARGKHKQTLELAVDKMKQLGGPDALAAEEPVLYARFCRQLDQLWPKIKPKADMSAFAPREWQQKIIDEISGEADDRTIHWVVDHEGGKGKTILAKYLVCEKNAFYIQGGKHADIVFGYKGQPIVVFDLCRDVEGYVPYSVMETLKNGILFSSKYVSQMQVFKVPHVLVFANFDPDMSKLSGDRWKITNLQ